MPGYIAAAAFLILLSACAQQEEPVRYVDPETGEVSYGD